MASIKTAFQSSAKADFYTSFDFEFHTVNIVFMQLFSEKILTKSLS